MEIVFDNICFLSRGCDAIDKIVLIPFSKNMCYFAILFVFDQCLIHTVDWCESASC